METSSAHSRREKVALAGVALIAAGVVAFYAFVSGALFQPHPFVKDNHDYYPMLVDGFRAGHLGFNFTPPAALTQLADPYDPLQRQQAGLVDLHDVSYYRGHYYLYFGVAPALTLFWPFRAITGVHFPQELGSILFCAGGYVCSLALFLGFRRRYFPATPVSWLWLGALMLGLGNFCPAMLARNSVWEVPIASAYFYSCLGLLWMFKAAEAKRRRGLWLALAGVAFGLCVASRPHFVFLCAMLGVFWLWDARRQLRSAQAPLPVLVRETAVLFLPIAAIVAGLLVYNYERFDHFLEFGQHLTLGGINQEHLPFLVPQFFPVNFYSYFLAPAQFQRYFPFVTVIRGYLGARPAGYTGIEDPYGILPNLPCFWLAVLAPLIWMWRGRHHPGVGRWLALFGLCFLGVAGATLCVNAATNRYMVDFLPTLLLVSAVMLLLVVPRGGLSLGGWRLLRLGLASAIFYSAVFSVLAAINHNGIFATNEPAAFAMLSRFFNRPIFAWEAAHPATYGPAEVTLRFPMDRPGAAEPILVTGASYRSDYLYAVYTPDGRHVQLGFSHTNYNQRVSQQIPLDYRVPHTLGIQMGSLYPAPGHPSFAGWTPAAILTAKKTLTVTLDGVPYFSSDQDFFDTTPGFVTFGVNDVSDFVSRTFSGRILGVARRPLPPAVAGFSGGGFLRLAVIMPAAKPGVREPLVSTGASGHSDLLFVEYLDDHQARFGFEHAGHELEFSERFSVVPGQIQLVEASLGSFYPRPGNARERELAQLLFVRLDGQSLWIKNEAFYPADSQPPVIGENRVGSVASAAAFTGKIVAQAAVQLFPAVPDSPFVFAPYWIETGAQPNYGPIRMRIALPHPMGLIEPLVVTGPSRAQADYISISSPVPGQVGFGYLQTGVGGPKSRHLPMDGARPVTVEIDMPSLYPAETDEFFSTRTIDEIIALKKGWLRLKANGTLLINAFVPYFESSAKEITLGENRISEVYGPRFTGRILSVERSRFEPPPGFAANAGPLEMVFRLPAAGSGRETLLATGPEAAPDALLVSYDGAGRCHFVVRMADGHTVTGTPLDGDPAVPHTLLVQWGGLYGDAEKRQNAVVSLDGQPAFSGRLDFQFAAPQPVSLGRASPGAPEFSGQLQSVRRLPATGH